MKKFYFLAFLLGFTTIYLSAQVTFTHTLNADFTKGITENVLVKNDGVALPFKKGSINDWTSTTNLPQNLSGHQMATWRNFVFLSGGFNGTKYNNYVYKATVNSSGISGWTQINSLPDSVGFHAMVATSTKLYVIGGKKGSYVSNKIYMATINDDGSTGTWSLSTINLPQPLWGLRAELINGFVYLTGGADETITALNMVYYSKIDAEDNLGGFIATTSLPTPSNGHSMVKYSGKLYVLGGYNASGLKKNTVYVSTINANGTCGAWSTATPLPVAISNHVSTCSNGIISVVGGEDETILSNKFYFADIDNSPAFTWELSDRYLYDRTKNAAAFAGDNQVVYAGGTNLSGSAVNSIRFAVLNPSTDRVKKGIFLSSPFFVGSPKNIQKLTYTITTQTGDSWELLYRLAGTDKVWGDWMSAGTDNPAMINQSKSYIQYMFRFLAASTSDIVLSDLTMTVSGYTQLCGSLDAMTTLTAAASPYWATCNISFNTGTHTIQPGVMIYFSPNTGLEVGQASVNFAGTAGQPVKLSFYDVQDGMWNGVYFKDASDAGGVTSQLTYTTIEKAGNGTNNANLWCSTTNQPVINNCTIQNSVGHGIRLESTNLQITGTIISNNTESGLYLSSSNPVLTNVTSKLSGYAGIYYATVGLAPVYTNTKSESNLYGLYSPTPDNSFAPATSTALQLLNNTTDIAINGGYITANRSWKYFPKGYVILGNVTIRQAGVNPILTLAPGNTIKFMPGISLTVGEGSTTGGQLYAVGKADSLITFTAYNGLVGGWNGLYFNDGSDYNSTSNLRHCIIEKGNEYNICSVNSNEPHLMFSTVRNSVTYGLKLQNSNINIEETTIKKASQGIYLSSSNPSMVLTVLDSLADYCVYMANSASVPTFYQCTMKNSKYGIFYPNPNYSIPNFGPGVGFINLNASIYVTGGTISSNVTWNYNSAGYVVGSLLIAGYQGNCRLTVKPGCMLKFLNNSRIQIGDGYSSSSWNWYGGELYACGKQDSIILFTPLNDSVNGWNGIYFHDCSDRITGMSSLLKQCIVQKASQNNILCESTTQPVIDSCIIRHSAGIGLNVSNSYLAISNSSFLNNTGYGLYYNTAYYVENLKNLTFSGNQLNGVIIAGGDISVNRRWNVCSLSPYIIMGNMRVINYQSNCRLTIDPGVTIKVVKNANIQVGEGYSSSSWNWYGGELFACGKPDSTILFTSLNDSIGGWNGIYFQDCSDRYTGMNSLLKHCIVQKASQNNLLSESTTQPVIDSCIIRYSSGIGINVSNSYLTISNSSFLNNTGYGLYYNTAYYVENLRNLNFSGNRLNGVVIAGGDISVNRKWNVYSISPYIILGNMRVLNYQSNCRLTIDPGVAIKVAKNANIQIGDGYSSSSWNWYGGELYACGKLDSTILFTALNDSAGGWNGIYFQDCTDMLSGMYSVLKYCTIQKASQYNLWCNNTTQPTIERTTISNGAGYGLWLDAANVTVKNSIIRDNLGYGLYLTSGSNPVIGNNYLTSNDIYNNSYNIYNNTPNNIDMRYNFLGSFDSSYLEKKVWHKIDNTSLGTITYTPFSWLPAAQGSAMNVIGKFLYDNKTTVPMTGATLTLKDQSNNTTIATATVNSTGSFSFSNLQLDVPTKINFTIPQTWSGVNATDALAVMRHFTFLSLLNSNHWFVSDVNKSKTLNGTDAMMIMQRFSGITTSFPTGDLQIDCDSLNLNSPNFNYNISALWFGDANGSYPNTSSKNANMAMIYEGAIHPGSWQEFPMRVKLKNRLDLGAVSLELLYPFEFLDVLGVKMTHTGENLLFTAQEGVLKTGWYNLNPIAISEDEVLLTILFKSKDLASQTTPISVVLGEDSELADGSAIAHQGVILSAPVIPITITGFENGGAADHLFSFNFFPNPARQTVTFTYTLPEPASIKISLTDIFGREIAIVTNGEQSQGEHTHSYALTDIPRGVCFIRFQYGDENTPRFTRKLIVQ